MKALEFIINDFGIKDSFVVNQFGTGLINRTYLVETPEKRYILQQINKEIFKDPHAIDLNMQTIGSYLEEHNPDYVLSLPLPNRYDRFLSEHELNFYRIFDFVENSHTINIVEKPEQAYEASLQFGGFTKALEDLETNKLKITLPDFHNLELRSRQYKDALKSGNKKRISSSHDLIKKINRQDNILTEYLQLKKSKALKVRVTHHDTKISNVLLNEKDEGICVIDLDTVMPGFFISDVGDMMRTYLSPAGEEDHDLSKIMIRKDFFEAIVSGYMAKMGGNLTDVEKNHFIYAGKFMIYMQALRFITDHINDDIYYGAAYEDHNYYRALNQVTLLEKLISFERTANNFH